MAVGGDTKCPTRLSQTARDNDGGGTWPAERAAARPLPISDCKSRPGAAHRPGTFAQRAQRDLEHLALGKLVQQHDLNINVTPSPAPIPAGRRAQKADRPWNIERQPVPKTLSSNAHLERGRPCARVAAGGVGSRAYGYKMAIFPAA